MIEHVVEYTNKNLQLIKGKWYVRELRLSTHSTQRKEKLIKATSADSS
jgi:hypothetical protein